MANQSTSFWSSLQGILMGVAAVITAITGLYVAMSGSSDSPSKENATTVVEVHVPPNASQSSGAESGNSSSPSTNAANEASTTTPKEEVVNFPSVVQPEIKKDIVKALPKAELKPVQTLNKQALQTIANSPVTLDCSLFPTNNTVKSLMSWSNYYHQQVVDAKGVKARAERPCKKTIAYRAQAYCADKTNIEVSQALGTTMRFCHQAGISWRDAVPPTP